MQIDHSAVRVEECQADTADYVVWFYPVDVRATTVKSKLPRRAEIVEREYDEGGNLTTWYVDVT